MKHQVLSWQEGPILYLSPSWEKFHFTNSPPPTIRFLYLQYQSNKKEQKPNCNKNWWQDPSEVQWHFGLDAKNENIRVTVHGRWSFIMCRVQWISLWISLQISLEISLQISLEISFVNFIADFITDFSANFLKSRPFCFNTVDFFQDHWVLSIPFINCFLSRPFLGISKHVATYTQMNWVLSRLLLDKPVHNQI